MCPNLGVETAVGQGVLAGATRCSPFNPSMIGPVGLAARPDWTGSDDTNQAVEFSGSEMTVEPPDLGALTVCDDVAGDAA